MMQPVPALLASIILTGSTVLCVSANIIDHFSYPTTNTTVPLWRSIDGSPDAVAMKAGGVRFPITFAEDRDRVYWDREGAWDFSSASGFQLDFVCPDPEAMRSLAVYFRSGKGWYIWNQPVIGTGRQTITLHKRDFSREGNPSGWDAIDRIRISPWRGKARTTELVAYRFSEVKEKQHALRTLVQENELYRYGLKPVDPQREFRGVWDHDAKGWYPGDWDRTAKLLSESGINAIFINATWAGLAHYQSAYLPDSFTYRKYGDQLAQCIQAAKKYNLEVHAWVVCWNVGNAPVSFIKSLRDKDRLQIDAKGKHVFWMNPAHRENRQHLLSVIKELATNYDLDGIHLDYIRYPGTDSCYGPVSRNAFEKSTGVSVERWPQDAMDRGIHHDAFIRWRTEIITSFVRDVRSMMNQTNPKLRLSAAVWGGYPQIISSIGQDWGNWMKEGLFDFVCPMNYTPDTKRFIALVDKQRELPNTKGQLFPGIGVDANEGRLKSHQVIAQINALRERGIDGFVLFDLSDTLVEDVLPGLRMVLLKP